MLDVGANTLSRTKSLEFVSKSIFGEVKPFFGAATWMEPTHVSRSLIMMSLHHLVLFPDQRWSRCVGHGNVK